MHPNIHVYKHKYPKWILSRVIITVTKVHSIATTAKFRSLKWLIPKTPLLLMWSYIKWQRNGFRTRTGGWEFWLLPWRWHILSIPFKADRGISAETCGLDYVFPPYDLGSGPCTPFSIYIPHIIAAFLLFKSTLSKRHTYRKLVWPCWCIGWFDTVWFQVCFQLYVSVLSMPWYGYR